ncbi:ABC transporter permease, partial [Kitasatospora sp. NPDC036755]
MELHHSVRPHHHPVAGAVDPVGADHAGGRVDEAAGGQLGVEVPGGQAAAADPQLTGRAARGDAWRDLRRRPIFLISAVLILLLVVMAVFPY